MNPYTCVSQSAINTIWIEAQDSDNEFSVVTVD